jgi:hypothetical protein
MPLHHSWHGPKHATPPLDFLEAIESRFELALFTLNKDDGR